MRIVTVKSATSQSHTPVPPSPASDPTALPAPPPLAASAMTPPPPPPPATPATPATPDPWFRQISVPGFDMRSRLTTPAELFGFDNPAGGTARSLDRATRMAQWLRKQDNSPWQWIDGQLRAIGQADVRYLRETPGSVGADQAWNQWATLVYGFEKAIEQRIRAFLGNDAKQRENTMNQSAAAITAGAAPAMPPTTPDGFDAMAFVEKLQGWGIDMEVAKDGLSFHGVRGRLGPAEFQAIETHRAAIVDYLSWRASLISQITGG